MSINTLVSLNDLYKRLKNSTDSKERIGLIKVIGKFYNTPKKLQKLIQMMVNKKLSDNETIYIMNKIIFRDNSLIGEYIFQDPQYSIILSYPDLQIKFSKFMCSSISDFKINLLKDLPDDILIICKKLLFKKYNKNLNFYYQYNELLQFCTTYNHLSSEDEIKSILNNYISYITEEDINKHIIKIRNEKNPLSVYKDFDIYRSKITYEDLTNILNNYKNYLSEKQIYNIINLFLLLSPISEDDKILKLQDLLTEKQYQYYQSNLIMNSLK